ncbi:MAG: hypothetical protein GYA59_13730 [Chloroflexi bacterium]|nr:hypothetical protein [Chloroflexota bacterium]
MNQALISSCIFAASMLVLCSWKPQVGRIVLGVFFLVMAGINLSTTLSGAYLYVDYGSSALLGPYRWFFREIVAQLPSFWGGMLVASEALVGLLLLGRDADVRLGILAAILFLLVITPLSTETFANMGLALAAALLLRAPHYHRLLGVLQKWFSPLRA